jgi:16S rRNA (cytidine1402-2'-O)-methyltransferase
VTENRGAGGTLYVVATPIGNLGDVTLRALEVLRTVPLIAAEDTRVARRLLDRYEIATRTTSYHARSPAARREALLAHLRTGADLALVSDAGTPGVSDPGDDLVGRWASDGGSVIPVPGASAVLAAVVASGIAGPRWAFEGFLPRSGAWRKTRLGRIAADDRATIIFEAPNRLARTLGDLAGVCGRDRRAAICRELTKVHEQVVRGTLGQLSEVVLDGTVPALGEAVLVVAPADEDHVAGSATGEAALASALEGVAGLVAGGLGRAEAARRVSAMTGIPRRRLYSVRESDPDGT